MAAKSALLSGSMCRACRRPFLRVIWNSKARGTAFGGGVELPSQSKWQKRSLVSGLVYRSAQRMQDQTIGTVDRMLREEEVNAQEEDDSVPWYLQGRTVESEVNPFAERQRIPAMPDNPPPILEPLFQHLSTDLGLDYLSFVDLRNLDPPPALGSNLIMIFGSARSDKHLNVAADRLCRWLRSNYKLSPYADGLLGRKELKVKLRRKNKRARILKAAGTIEPMDVDDGIRTGWICVNAGTVKTRTISDQNEEQEQATKVTGFGPGIDSVKLVVQIMTESKRGEIDLEGLWQSAAEQATRREAGEERANEKARIIPSSRETFESTDAPETIFGATNFSSSRAANLKPFQQARSFHAFGCLRASNPSATSTSQSKLPDESELEPHILEEAPATGLGEDVDDHANVSSTATAAPSTAFNSKAQVLALRTQLTYIKTLAPKTAVGLLGRDQDDKVTTTFLKSFYSNFPVFPDSEHLALGIELHCYAIEIGHIGYTHSRLMGMLREMQASGLAVPESTFLLVFGTILNTHNSHEMADIDSENPEGSAEHRLRRALARGFDILEWMESQGYDIRTKQVFTALHRAISEPVVEEPPSDVDLVSDSGRSPQHSSPDGAVETSAIGEKQQRRYNYHFRRVVDILYNPQPGDNDLYLSMLRTYANTSDWGAFWDLWRHMARTMRPRPPEMYALMFRSVASTGDESKCQNVLMTQVPEMSRESPPVEMKGDVAAAVVDCLVSAKVEMDGPPWAAMWRRARAA